MRAPLSVLLGAALMACAPMASSVARAAPVESMVDLNQATLEQLQGLPGIGLRKANAIVELRRKRPFTRVTQLLEVKGIGKKTLERLKVHVKVAAVLPAGSIRRASSGTEVATGASGASAASAPVRHGAGP